MLTDKIQSIEDIEPDEIIQPQENENNYQFVDGFIDPDDSLSEFLEDFQKPKEETGATEQPNDDEIPDEDDSVTSEQAKYTASFIVDVVDEAMAHGLALYSLNPVDEHRAGKEQKKHLKKLWAQYCKEKVLEIPTGTQIIIAMASIYAVQIPKARQDRKANLKLERIREEQDRLYYDRKLLEFEKERLYSQRKAQEDGE